MFSILGNTYSSRVHFPASYVSLPEWNHPKPEFVLAFWGTPSLTLGEVSRSVVLFFGKVINKTCCGIFAPWNFGKIYHPNPIIKWNVDCQCLLYALDSIPSLPKAKTPFYSLAVPKCHAWYVNNILTFRCRFMSDVGQFTITWIFSLKEHICGVLRTSFVVAPGKCPSRLHPGWHHGADGEGHRCDVGGWRGKSKTSGGDVQKGSGCFSSWWQLTYF